MLLKSSIIIGLLLFSIVQINCIEKNIQPFIYRPLPKGKSTAKTCFHNDLRMVEKPEGNFEAIFSFNNIIIDGSANDSVWLNTHWYSLNYNWMGNSADTNDYYGRFKLAWDSLQLYILVEITDDYLNQTLADGKENYWKGDYVEIFIDEDHSGGNHKYNHQAFAYHVSTEGHAIDKDTHEKTVFFDSHINVIRNQQGNKHLWEMSVLLFDKNFDENATNNLAVKITEGKKIGFSLAYGDNDGNQTRENFMGSKATHGLNNDEGYINSDVFGSILFVK